ncbi:MAG: undecaprenyl-phosphate glucose phosphotransferase [Alphaproteobacteria bacterium]|nr:undecaprenyl-phosphate glucose phosphotransferase [Alphaproteobacteria bacterium]
MPDQDFPSAAKAMATGPSSSGAASERRGRSALPHFIYGDIIQFVDFVTISLNAVLVSYIYHIEVLIADFDYQLYASAGIIGATGLTALLRRDGCYDFERLLSSSRGIPAILTRWAMVLLGLIAFAFTLKISGVYSRIWLFTWAASTIVILAGVRVAASAYLRREAKAGGVFGRRVALIGAKDTCEAFQSQLNDGGLGVTVVDAFSIDDAGESCGHNLFADEVRSIVKLARDGAVDDVLIAPRNMDRETMRRLINQLSDLPVSVAVLSSVHWLDHRGGEVIRIGGAPALRLYRRPLEGWGSFVKTLEDRILGTLIFIAASPILVACAIALMIQGGGPILFVQQRHGFNHEVFRIYKFRTMTVAEDGDSVTQATRNDARVTKVGAFLRKWSLDELPQLINVLKGEMSLVGPRPHALAHNDAYARTVVNYSGRHKVKPGITGWAQVNGYRGETSENEHMAMRVKYDLEYIDNWSLWFDFKIIALTVSAVLFPRNAY